MKLLMATGSSIRLAFVLFASIAILAPAAVADAQGLGSEEHFVDVLRRSTSIAEPAAFTYFVVGDQEALAFALAPDAVDRFVSGSVRTVRQGGAFPLGELLVIDQAGVVDGGCIPIPIWLRWLRGRYELVALDGDGEVMATIYPELEVIEGLFAEPQEIHLRGTKPKVSDVIRVIGEVLIAAADFLASIGLEIDDGPNATWTEWLNRDHPSGSGDFETLRDLVSRGQACSMPLDIQCRSRDGRDWSETGQTYTCEQHLGGVCRHSNQSVGRCLDYEVRFLCAD